MGEVTVQAAETGQDTVNVFAGNLLGLQCKLRKSLKPGQENAPS